MFKKFFGKFFTKKALPFITANLDLDVDTVEKSDGKYLRIRVEVLDIKLLDRFVKISEDEPIDIFETNRAMKLPDSITKKLDEESSSMNSIFN